MILYHAITTYHILKFAIHKLKFHPFEEAVLILPSFIVHKPSELENEIFSQIFYFTWERCGKQDKDVFGEISKQINEFFGNDGIKKFNEINVARAEYWFGSWLVEKKCPFQWFEDGDGRLSNPTPIQLDDKRVAPNRYDQAMKLNLYTGNNPFVIKKYINLNAQLSGFKDSVAVDFNVMKELKSLPKDKQTLILKLFGLKQKIDVDRFSALLITQHFSNIGMMTYEDQVICYQMTLDYFLENFKKVYFKWHPSDLTAYPSYFNNIYMLSGNYPSELLSLVLNTPFEVGCSISSTGLLNLQSICKKRIIFNEAYIKTFNNNHQYYFCLKLMEIFPKYNVCLIGVNEKQFKNFIEFGGVDLKNSVTYVNDTEKLCLLKNRDGLPNLYFFGGEMMDLTNEVVKLFYMENKSDNNIFVFLNCYNEDYFYDLIYEAPITVKEIHIRSIDQKLYGLGKDIKPIVLITNNNNLRKEIQNMKYVKKLINTGIELEVLDFSDKEDEIASLRGMLQATKRQLQKYMDENQKLKRKDVDKNCPKQ